MFGSKRPLLSERLESRLLQVLDQFGRLIHVGELVLLAKATGGGGGGGGGGQLGALLSGLAGSFAPKSENASNG